MHMITPVLKTVTVYFVLILSMRLMGKRQLGELQASEFIIAIMLSEIATTPITNPEYPLTHALLAIFALVALEILVSALLIRSNPLKRLFYGRPVLLIRKGELDISAMKKNRIELDELLCELRQKGYSDISCVNYAVLEENGKLSVFPKASKSPPNASDLNLDIPDSGIAHLLILDGTVIDKNLSAVGWSMGRLYKELRKRRTEPQNVFLMTVDDLGSITFIPKNRKQDA